MVPAQTLSLEQIEALARDESAKLQHFYVGVEHLFIALTRLDGGLVPDVLAQVGSSPRYLRYVVRDLAGRGEERRYWTGYPLSPRASAVLDAAGAYVRTGKKPAERALLLAILDEGQSIPIRALRSANIDLERLREAILDWSGEAQVTLPPPEIEGDDKLSDEQRAILSSMFRGYARVRIEQLFAEGFSGYSGSTVILVRPLHADRRADALVVVKLYDRQGILWEKKRYDSYVRDRLPPKTARIETDPTLPDGSLLGGLKYTFVRRDGESLPVNLGKYMETHDPETVALFLRDALYGGFRETWWGQAQPYSFPAWQEYELMLPPALIVEAADSVAQLTLRPESDLTHVHTGEVVALEDFTVLKVKRDKTALQLVRGAGAEAINYAGRIDLHGLDFSQKVYYRGQIIEHPLVGRVLRTREDILQEYVQKLEPDFDLLAEFLPALDGGQPMPNPLRHYGRLLEKRITGTFSTIHGDFHTGNILVGPGGDAWLIDFEWARDGHTLVDWAVLEVSILIDHIITFVAADWETIRGAAALLDRVNHHEALDPALPLGDALRPVVEVRHIVSELLANRANWSEYFISLAFCALRAITWANRPLAARRLAYLVSALAIGAAERAAHAFTQTTSDLTVDQTKDQHPGSMIDSKHKRPG